MSGQIQTNGDAFLKMEGITGNVEYNINRVSPGTPFVYTATAHFAGRSGSGKRNESRSCELTFAKS